MTLISETPTVTTRPASPGIAGQTDTISELPSSRLPPSKPLTPPTYYEQPALKPSPWGWKVSAYIFVAGLAGSSQIVAMAADLAGGEESRAVVRYGRYIAVAGAAIGAPLLIADLHTPRRFYNMLRIFRPTSAMSIGTYVLLGFGGSSALLAGAQLLRDGRGQQGEGVTSRLLQVPAALLGAAMSTYTGALLGATSTPLWAAAPRLIAALFGASAMASGAAALRLAAPGHQAKALDRLTAAASAIEIRLLFGLRANLLRRGVRTNFAVAPIAITAALPLLHQLAGALERPSPGSAASRRAATYGTVSAIAALAGAFMLRHAVLRAGNRSAKQPLDYFRLAALR